MSYSVLIADDEPHARDYLVRLVKEETALALIGQCASGNEVLAFCKTLTPDILLLDIQMPGLNGIDTAHQLMQSEARPIIIFTTAFDQYAIDAFNVAALAYLLKPFSKADFQKTLERALSQLAQRDKVQFSERINRLWERYRKPPAHYIEGLTVKVKGLDKNLPVQDIIYLQSDSEYAAIHTLEGKYLQRLALKILEDQLPPGFKRIHRSVILNTEMIESWQYLQNNTFRFLMKNGEQLTSSRTYKKTIEGWL